MSVQYRRADEGVKRGFSNQSSHFLMEDIWLNREEERRGKEGRVRSEEEGGQFLLPVSSHQSQIHTDLQVNSLISLNGGGHRVCVCVCNRD